MLTVSDAVLNRRNFSIVSLATTLSACGGGGDSDDSPVTAPKILTQPGNASLRAGAIATFRVIAQSEHPMSYQWLRNGSPITGATAAELSIGPVNVSDSGDTFSVRVNNSAGTTQSASATLMVEAVEGIALAQGALSKLSYDETAVGFSSAGDIFVWDRGPSSVEQYPMRLIRLASDGTPRPLLGSKQTLDLKSPWRVSVLEHSNGSIYVSESYATVFGLNTYAGNYGRIHRITPEGVHSVIYDAAASAIRITPLVLAEGPGARLYTLHVNTVSLYEISETGTPSLVSGLTTEPVLNLAMVFAAQPYLNMAVTRGGGVFISNIPNSTEPFFKFKDIVGMGSIGEYVYALIREGKEGNSLMSLMRRNPDGSTQRIAGGVEASWSADPQPGPLTGSLGGGAIRLIGVMPDGNVVLGRSALSGRSPEDYKYVSYFVVTPPKV